MLAWLMRRRIDAFERAYDYDAGYLHDILAASPRALAAFGRAAQLGRYSRDLPEEVRFAAQIVTTMAEDCGPCTQITVTMAERARVAPALLRAILAEDEAAMSEEARLGFRFARAVLAHDTAADELRAEVLRRWGRHGLVSLAFAITGARLFPTVKYALGHGQSCARVTVGGAAVPVLRQVA